MVFVRHHARDWRAYLARGGLVLALCAAAPLDRPSPSGGNAQAQSQAATAQEHQHNQDAQAHANPTAPIAEKQTEDQHTVAPKSEGNRHWYAEPDWWIAGGTIALAVFTAGLWIFTALLWNATRKAVKDTAESVKLTERSVIAAERAGHVERAWIFFADVSHGLADHGHIDDVLVGRGYHVTIRWRNGGRTPAIRVLSAIDYKVIERGQIIPSFDIQMPAIPSRGIVGQGQEATTNTKLIPEVEITPVMQRNKMLILYGKIEYFDVFNDKEKRTSEVTIHFDFNGVQTDVSGKTSVRAESDQSGSYPAAVK